MLACLCCKKGDIGFKELDNAEGEDYTTEFSVQSSPAAQNGPEVYVLPLTEVSVPMSKQPGRSVQLLKSSDLGRQSLLYLKEIGHGWFGKVLLGEVNSGISSTQVVVKELKVSASVQEQMLFLEETHPYRVLQQDNLLQCLAQCAEITPYLLVMEFCPLGDLKGYLQSCAGTESTMPDPLTLQRMGCEVCCGLLHLHKNNYTHSDLALRNCLLTSDLTVKIGDYGLAHSKYRDDYLVTSDQLWVPLRWIAPELIDEVHGNLLVVDQTKASNIWSLGVTLWELFELGRQPYQEYSDRQVLGYVIKEQQLKLPKPQLKQLLSDRWFEVMQFCWLQPEQRPTAEEVHLLLSYLSVKGASELEEEFEKRWNSMKPNAGDGGSGGHHEAELSSYPLLEHFSSDGFHSDGDDVLTVTQTSQGLNFEYKWERGRQEQYPLSPGCPPYQDMYYTSNMGDQLSLGVSPSCYENKDCIPGSRPLEVVPVVSARSPSVAGDYYIRIEEPLSSSFPQHESPPSESCVTGEEASEGRSASCGISPSISVSMEPLLTQAGCSSVGDQVTSSQDYGSSGDTGTGEKPFFDPLEVVGCGAGGFMDPLGVSPSLRQLCQARLGPAESTLSDRSESIDRRLTECSSNPDSIVLNVEDEGGLQSTDFQGELSGGTPQLTSFSPHWASNISSNNNISSASEGHKADTWCNRRAEESQAAETEPYGPESWQTIESGDAESVNLSVEETSDSLSNHREEDCSRGGSGWPDGQRDGEICLSTADVGQIEFTPPCSENVGSPHNMFPSPSHAVREFNEGMDPLGVTLLRLCEPPALPQPMHPVNIYEGGDAASPLRDLCSCVLLDGVTDLCLSPSKENENPDKSSLTDLYPTQSDSGDEDTMEVTSGVFTDLSSERGDTLQSFRPLQKQVGTPDSLDSLDMPSTASSCEAFSLTSYTPCAQARALDSGYDTENYESPEFVQKEPQDGRENEPYYPLSQTQEHGLGPGEMSISRSVSSELQSLDAKNPYRDSAYFSDYESFTKEEEDEEEKDQESGAEAPHGDSGHVKLELQHRDGTENAPDSKDCIESGATISEDSVDEGLGMETPKEATSDEVSSPQPAVEVVPHRTFTLSPVQTCLTKACPVKQGVPGMITLTTGLQEEKAVSSHREAHGIPHLSKCLSPPLPRKEGRVGDSTATEDEDEDEESDDSDESDEELRCYNIQEHSEESEEEHGAVPIIITENGSASHLRSLLKLPNFVPEMLSAELDRKKKAVSFYDDVTVYLFNQESPTRELAEEDFPETPLDNGAGAAIHQEGEGSPRVEPADQRLLEGSSVLPWEGELPLTPVKSSFVTSLSPAMLSPDVHSLPVPIQKPALPVRLSRFSVSPTPLSRFSITHVADSEVASVEGRADTGEQA
uniref:non-specific serine/threonine protein kinase n=1 Tax=Leptobrachium leishanense TaxID=445787 RepID=A0A8C5R9W7_9ANUR